jgi:hypothetical protein
MFEKCPQCGSETTFGYGLMGGGCGAYQLCLNDKCEWFVKEQDEEQDEDEDDIITASSPKSSTPAPGTVSTNEDKSATAPRPDSSPDTDGEE